MPPFKDAMDEEVAGIIGKSIALESCVVKVMTRVLAGRHSEFAENFILTKGQGGFKPGRGCTDQVLVLRDVCDIMRSKGDRHFGISGCKKDLILCGEKECR